MPEAGALFKQVGKGGSGVAFGGVAMLMELGEGSVVVLDGLVRMLEGEEAHCADKSKVT